MWTKTEENIDRDLYGKKLWLHHDNSNFSLCDVWRLCQFYVAASHLQIKKLLIFHICGKVRIKLHPVVNSLYIQCNVRRQVRCIQMGWQRISMHDGFTFAYFSDWFFLMLLLFFKKPYPATNFLQKLFRRCRLF